MYLNKLFYYAAKIVVGFGNFFWGGLALLISLVIIVPGAFENTKNGFSIFLSIATIWAAHFWFGTLLQKAKFYNTFFENDKDGRLELRVLSRATGVEENQLQKDLVLLGKFHLMRHFSIALDKEYSYVTLYIPNRKVSGGFIKPMSYQKTCLHCGAENKVTEGFVNQCPYCGGSMDE